MFHRCRSILLITLLTASTTNSAVINCLLKICELSKSRCLGEGGIGLCSSKVNLAMRPAVPQRSFTSSDTVVLPASVQRFGTDSLMCKCFFGGANVNMSNDGIQLPITTISETSTTIDFNLPPINAYILGILLLILLTFMTALTTAK
uniref:Secreted protein n=1 Tax=Globodera rostochiensis TaxID=31243 RepID=A0A914GRZ6_GLORO